MPSILNRFTRWRRRDPRGFKLDLPHPLLFFPRRWIMALLSPAGRSENTALFAGKKESHAGLCFVRSGVAGSATVIAQQRERDGTLRGRASGRETRDTGQDEPKQTSGTGLVLFSADGRRRASDCSSGSTPERGRVPSSARDPAAAFFAVSADCCALSSSSARSASSSR